MKPRLPFRVVLPGTDSAFTVYLWLRHQAATELHREVGVGGVIWYFKRNIRSLNLQLLDANTSENLLRSFNRLCSCPHWMSPAAPTIAKAKSPPGNQHLFWVSRYRRGLSVLMTYHTLRGGTGQQLGDHTRFGDPRSPCGYRTTEQSYGAHLILMTTVGLYSQRFYI